MAEGGESRYEHYVYIDQRSVFNFGEIGNVSIGDINTGPQTTSSDQPVQSQDEIAAELDDWSEGMVQTTFYHQILEKLQQGERWLTVKGSPGEGKSTAVRMALRQLQKTGRNVFIARNPDNFRHIARKNVQPVIVLDDILGDIMFNISKWNRWEHVFHEQLDLKEHRLNMRGCIKSEENHPTVILILRDYVLNGAAVEMGNLHAYIAHESRVINMSYPVERGIEEKRKILEAVVFPHIHLSEKEIDNILSTDGCHGFANICKMFVTIRNSSPSLSPQKFFKTPLSFLNKTIKVLIKNKNVLSLFKEMIKSQGRISERELQQFEPDVKQQAKDLIGTYLKTEGGHITFNHESIMDSVSFTLGGLHTVFVIENCSMSLIYERIRLESAADTDHKSEQDNDLLVYISDAFKEDLAKRFAREITERNFALVLIHEACTQRDFVNLMMSHVNIPLKKLLQTTYKVDEEAFYAQMYPSTLLIVILTFILEPDILLYFSFMTHTPATKSLELFKYIESQPGIRLNKEHIKSVIWGACKFGAIVFFDHLIELGYKLDLDARCGIRNRTPLMVAVIFGHSDVVDKLLSLGCDVSAGDNIGNTALHYACHCGHVKIVEKLMATGVGVDTGKKTSSVQTGFKVWVHSLLTWFINSIKGMTGIAGWEHSPLWWACHDNHVDVVKLLLSRGACVTEDIERVAQKKSNAKIQKLILKDKK